MTHNVWGYHLTIARRGHPAGRTGAVRSLLRQYAEDPTPQKLADLESLAAHFAVLGDETWAAALSRALHGYDEAPPRRS